MRLQRIALAVVTFAAAACSGNDDASPAKTDEQLKQEAVTGMHDVLLADLEELVRASVALKDAVPAPSGRGWSRTEDAAAIAKAKEAWLRARIAYEHVEGAVAPLFPDIDASIDARYDDFLAETGGRGDPYLFDHDGVTGMHAIERVLWADEIPARIVQLEETLPGYQPAAFPASEREARDFKELLCAKMLADATTMRDEWKPAKVDVAIAYRGLVSLVGEQREKVTKASSNEEESRYSQRTMADIRANLEGTRRAYAVFAPWLASKPGGSAHREKIEAGFTGLDRAYAEIHGDAIPQPPATWSASAPSAADLETPFGRLYASVTAASDPHREGSIVAEMNAAAKLLGFVTFKEK